MQYDPCFAWKCHNKVVFWILIFKKFRQRGESQDKTYPDELQCDKRK